MGAPIALLASSMALGPCVAMAIVFGTGALAFEPRYLLAVGGIVVGNTMTIATLTLLAFRQPQLRKPLPLVAAA